MLTNHNRILVVDDVPMNTTLLETILADEGYEALTANDAFEALKIMNREPVDLLLLDAMMPKMNGFELCRALRADPKYKLIPVIMLTALAQKESRIESIESGADDYIIKPFDNKEVLARIRSLLKVRELNKRVEKSYDTITSLISYTDLSLKKFNPVGYSIAQAMGGMADSFIRKVPTDIEKPSHILIISSKSSLFYHMNGGKLVGETLENISLPTGFNEGDGLAYNCNGSVPALIQSHLLNVVERIGAVDNFVVAGSDTLTVVAFNYLRKVDRMDAQVIKGFVIHNKFFNSLSSQVKETEDAFIYTVGALARAAEANDEDTGNHIVRVGEYAEALAVEMRLPEKLIEDIKFSAQMHDVGKIHVPMDILKKPGKLTEEEFGQMKHHTIYGARILGDAPRLTMCRTIALSHHERYDGTGYPYGLKGEDIPIEGRILSIADQYDAMRNPRVYKPSFPHEKAVGIITEGDGRTIPQHFDPEVLRCFKDICGRFEEIYGRRETQLVNSE